MANAKDADVKALDKALKEIRTERRGVQERPQGQGA